jgi:hypothetical protein
MRAFGLTGVVLGYVIALGIGLGGGLTMLVSQSALGIDGDVAAVYGSAVAGCLVLGLLLVSVGRRILRRSGEAPNLHR